MSIEQFIGVLFGVVIIALATYLFGLLIYQFYLFKKMIEVKTQKTTSFIRFYSGYHLEWWDEQLDVILNMVALFPFFYFFIEKNHYPVECHDLYEKRKKFGKAAIVVFITLMIISAILSPLDILP